MVVAGILYGFLDLFLPEEAGLARLLSVCLAGRPAGWLAGTKDAWSCFVSIYIPHGQRHRASFHAMRCDSASGQQFIYLLAGGWLTDTCLSRIAITG